MLKTIERINDPVAFVTENLGQTEQLQQEGFQIVSGSDLDVLITPQTITSRGRIDTEVSSLLGSLYMKGIAHDVILEGTSLSLEWYPSPTAANELSENLGLTPGKDVLKFVHAKSDIILPNDYEQHLKNGEYPQSTGGIRRFRHDRDDTHAVGVYFMPDLIFEGIANWKNLKERFGEKTLVGTFDATSYTIPGILNQLKKSDFDVDQFDKSIRGIMHYQLDDIGYILGLSHEWIREGKFKPFKSRVSHKSTLEALKDRYLKIAEQITTLQEANKNSLNIY